MTYESENTAYIQTLFFNQVKNMRQRKANTEELMNW